MRNYWTEQEITRARNLKKHGLSMRAIDGILGRAVGSTAVKLMRTDNPEYRERQKMQMRAWWHRNRGAAA